MEQALAPFRDIVDEIVIILGGKSRDKTPKLAKKLADKMAAYDGELDDKGRLLDFAHARQQSFDLLSTDWAIVVDCDDTWHGAEHIPFYVEQAIKHNAPAIQVAYHIGTLRSHQARIFKRSTGMWIGAIHESFSFFEDQFGDEPPVFIKTSDVWMEQNRSADIGADRHDQNIQISLKALEADPNDLRVLSHLTADYLRNQDYEKVIETADRYLAIWHQDEQRDYSDELYYTLYKKALAQITIHHYEDAAITAIKALQVLNTGSAWSILSEAFVRMNNGTANPVLPELALFAADKALSSGRARSGFSDNIRLSTAAPLHIKAIALNSLGRQREAIAALDLGLLVQPDNERMEQLRAMIGNYINEAV